ncbi:uncharacterized protein LOC126763543 isoform X1 [Bactrocera neohumeralis]|uniref:uncharacterized protein LOC126763543 isoform X1 n=3 Tax=Bactrocera neohumeralis TaxID=98809 RepID=UPI002165F3B2|nr:uncharacterized protein LOC126763543 isoform X1 [Bactrocera neohumeralis]
MDCEEYKEYRSKLIALVRKNKVLWDKTKKVRLSYAAKSKIWNSIGKELGQPGEMVRKHWACLRDQYRRDVKKQVVDGVESSWIFFDEMTFIRKFLHIRYFDGSLDSEDSEIINKSVGPKKKKTCRRSYSRIIPTTGNFMTQIFSTASDHVNSDCQEQQEQQQGGDSPTKVNSTTRLHRPIKTDMDNESVDTIINNASMEPPNETVIELLDERAQISKNTERTHSQLGNRAEFTPNKQSHRLPPVSNVYETPRSLDIPVIEIKDEVEILAAENDTVADTTVASENSTNIMETDCSINEKNSTGFSRNTSKHIEIEKEPTDKEDDDYHFVISLLPTLRRISHDRKLKTRMEIMKAVMEAAQSNAT